MNNIYSQIGGTTVQPLPQLQIGENPGLDEQLIIEEPPPHPIIEEPQIPVPEIQLETIVTNNHDIRRLCRDLATLINNSGINKSRLKEFSQSTERTYYTGPLEFQQNKQPPLNLDGYDISENSILRQIQYYIKMATNPDINKRRSFNFRQSIIILQDTIQDLLTIKYNRAVEADRRNQSIGGFISNPNANIERLFGYGIPLGSGAIGGIFSSILSIICETYGGNPSIKTIRDYCNLLLRLYTRIETILNENGIQQGGLRRRTNKKKYKNKKTKKNKIKSKKYKRKNRRSI
jgi:hypothetical protein